MSESNHISRHLNDELFDFCNSESELISEAGLREIIQRNQLHPTITCGRLSFLQRESHQGNIIRCLLEYFSAAGVGTAADGW